MHSERVAVVCPERITTDLRPINADASTIR